MRIYFSGIGGVGIGSLAETARDAGYEICGSDISDSLMTKELEDQGANIFVGKQDGTFLEAQHEAKSIDLVVYTAALPNDHPELVKAKQLGIRTAKRDELLAEIIREKGLKLIAVAGTHGKTTTTGMMVWALKQLGVPVSYSIGTTLSWGPSGHYDTESEYFVYECDEFDRNFLHFEPFLSIITAIDYDHPDTYPTPDDYRQAFVQFMEQSGSSLLWEKDLRYLKHPDIPASYQAFDELMDLSHIKLAGEKIRQNAFLVEQAAEKLFGEVAEIEQIINSFPGTVRRFEKLGENLYSDYGHHPAEIKATLQMARELSDYVVLVYQPHQNIRQHEIIDQYTPDIFADADEVYWLPTYLSREDPELEILTPEQLSARLDSSKVHISEMDDVLAEKLQQHRDAGHLVLCMGAGTVDGWVREKMHYKTSIILASQSPRRRDYMQRMGLTFETIPSDYDEHLNDDRAPDEIAMELALGKAMTVAKKYPNAIVIGSDCIIAANRHQMGKAQNIDDAREMLIALSGKESTVNTGLAVVQLSTGKKVATVDVSTLNFKPNSEKFRSLCEEYLTTGDWRDKAGAFGIQSGGHTLVESIKGDYSSIVGLPTVLLAKILTDQFGIVAKPVYDTPPAGIKIS